MIEDQEDQEEAAPVAAESTEPGAAE